MTEAEYNSAVHDLLAKYGMNYGATACPTEFGGYYTSPQIFGSVLVPNPEHLDEVQRREWVNNILEEHLKAQCKPMP